ncbi:hypothetical protein D6745_00360 [Candidatus Woesearchaeota archaeon]|nr:MAG: hypothetical protein D6745_00360 [Candidatus Woesearchaeota archaeon]
MVFYVLERCFTKGTPLRIVGNCYAISEHAKNLRFLSTPINAGVQGDAIPIVKISFLFKTKKERKPPPEGESKRFCLHFHFVGGDVK